MSNLPPISFRPGAPQPQYTSNIMGMPQHNQYTSAMFPVPGMGPPPQPSGFFPGGPFGASPFGAAQVNPQPAFPGMNSNFQTQVGASMAPRQTFFAGKSAVSQNMNQAHANHLKTLTAFFEKEFVTFNPKPTIVNNSLAQNGAMTIDLIFDFKIEQNSLPIKVTLEKDFPTSRPKLFSVQALDHQCVNKSTQEIDFSKFYAWDKEKSKIAELATATLKYFTQNSPFTNDEGKKLENVFLGVDNNAIQAFKKIDLNAFYNSLSASEKESINKNDEWATIELLRKTPDYQKLFGVRKVIGKCLTTLSQTISKEISDTENAYNNMKNAQNLAQASSSDLSLLYTSAAMESQKFEKSNVMQLLNQHFLN